MYIIIYTKGSILFYVEYRSSLYKLYILIQMLMNNSLHYLTFKLCSVPHLSTLPLANA